MMSSKNAVKVFLVCGVLCAGGVSGLMAHYIWIECPDKNEAKVYFGGFMELKEKAGGRLDEIANLEIWQWPQGVAKPALVKWEKKEDHLLVSSLKEDAVIIANDTTFPVKDWKEYDIGVVKPMFYARFQEIGNPKSAQPYLDLDVLMTKDNICGVFFKKQPLAGEKVIVNAPNGWMREYKSNESGQAAIETPWPGQYVVEVIHKEAGPGTFGGKEYEAIRHRATCTFVKK